MTERRRLKKKSRDDNDTSDEDGVERMPYWVPESGIDQEVMAIYLRTYVDRDPKIRIGNHPHRTSEKGYFVYSMSAITREDIMAMMEDSKSWTREGKDGYYVDSQTWKSRQQEGRSEPPKGRPIAQIRPRSAVEDPRPENPRTKSQPTARASADDVQMSDRPRSPVAAPSRSASIVSPQYDPYRQQNVQPVARYNQSTGTQQHSTSYSAQQMQRTSHPTSDGYQGGRLPTQPTRDDPNQPDNTGTHGFQKLGATASPPRLMPRSHGPVNQTVLVLKASDRNHDRESQEVRTPRNLVVNIAVNDLVYSQATEKL